MPNFLFKFLENKNSMLFFWDKQISLLFFFFFHHINFQYRSFVDLVSCDFMEKKNRFTSVYNLISYSINHRLFFNVTISDTLAIDSIIQFYPNAM